MGRLISCKDASRLISRMQEERLPVLELVRIRLHLLWCEACKNFLDDVRFLRAAMRRYRE
jgi:hypothetical protein